jgi:hypothetical protein
MVAFVSAFHLVPQIARQPSILAGRVRLGDTASKLLGVLWLLCALGFSAAAVGAVLQVAWWPALVFSVSPVSLVLSMMYWPAMQLGVPINLLILAMMLLSRWSGWPIPGH